MIGYLKAQHPGVKIILGGGLVTTWLNQPHWSNPFGELVDHLIGGQGEGPLLSLLGTQQEKNIYSRPMKGSRIITIFPLVSSCPTPVLSAVSGKNAASALRQARIIHISTYAPNTTITDLQALTAATSPAIIHLLDNAISPTTMKALVESPAKVPWYGFARIDTLLADRDFCRRLKDSGCIMLKLGLESGDQEVLNNMNKGIKLKLAAKVLENLQEIGIASYVYLLFGTPSESRKEAERTLSFVENHHQAISFLNLAIFNLPDCSEEVANLEVADFYDGDLSIYRSFTHPKGWNRGEVRRFLDSTFKRSPKIAAILRHDPPFFTSNHAPFIK